MRWMMVGEAGLGTCVHMYVNADEEMARPARHAPPPLVDAELVLLHRAPRGHVLPALALAGQFPPQLELERVEGVEQRVALRRQAHLLSYRGRCMKRKR